MSVREVHKLDFENRDLVDPSVSLSELDRVSTFLCKLPKDGNLQFHKETSDMGFVVSAVRHQRTVLVVFSDTSITSSRHALGTRESHSDRVVGHWDSRNSCERRWW